jgi:NADH dehydrogenase
MLITGATGFIGSRLASLALADGYSVRTLTRADWATAPAVAIDQRYFGTLPEQIPGDALQGVDVVVHCAAQVDGGEKSSFAVNVEGTIRLAQMAHRAGAQTFIFLSSQSARPDALSSYGRTKYTAERALLAEKRLQVIILRPGLVTGSGGKGLFGRMSRVVQSLPLIPMLGGGRSIVQPIHVDDLCAAIFRCDEMATDLKGTILHLGDPRGVTLRDFLGHIALVRLGRRKRILPIPLWPVEVAVKVAEVLRIPLPITSNNLKGMKTVERMETAADLARLGLDVRPLTETVRDDPGQADEPLSPKERAIRVLLIGAGRIGLVHAVTLSRLHGAVLAGIVDPKKGATALLRGMGVSVPMFRTLDEALSRVKPDAAVIATPVSTHLSLARACLAQGLAVMVEKPLAIRREQLHEYEGLAEEFPALSVQVGYVLPRNPQVASCLERLRSGEFGKVRGFGGLTLLSLIQDRSTKRWETNKDMSGGGALINAGGHVLSMIRAAFGDPEAVEAQTLRLHSTEVEDSIVVRLRYPEFSGTHYCSWSINGHPRQDNTLTIWTEQGRLILTGSVGVFIRNAGKVDITHQLDFDVGFNIAPDYAGAGFTTELIDLKEAARTGRVAPMSVTEAVGIERLLFKIYEASREVTAFTEADAAPQPAAQRVPEPAAITIQQARPIPAVKRVLDLRDLSTPRVHEYLQTERTESLWNEYLLNPDQVKGVPQDWRRDERLRVTVPDFLTQSRLLSNGRYIEVLKQMRLKGFVSAAQAATSVLLSERGPTFWVAAMGLLGAGLSSVPARFRGTLLLHGYLSDFALALRRLDVLEQMLATCRRLRPDARVGFHTNMAVEALNALHLLDVPVDEVSILTSPSSPGMAAVFGAVRRSAGPGGMTLTAEVGLAPSVVHRLALHTPERWAFGADAVLIGVAADPTLNGLRRSEVDQDWARAFPGLALPEGVL